MKLLTATLLIVLSLTACGGAAPTAETKSAQPEQAMPATSEPLHNESASATVEPTEEAPPTQSAAATVESAMPEPAVETTAESMAATQEALAAMPEESETAAADTPVETEEPPVEALPVEVDWLTSEGKTADNLAYLGNPEAAITIIDYSDFLWGACRAYVLGTEPELKETYVKTGQAKLVFNPMLDHGDRSLQAHQAAECAAEQGRFWAMHDILFERQGDLFGGNVQDTLKAMAAEIGLDSSQFNPCLDEQRYAGLVQSQNDRRHSLGIRTRPTFDINGQYVVGAQQFGAFQGVIEPLLAQ